MSQHVIKVTQFDKKMFGFFFDWRAARDHRDRVSEIGWCVGGTTGLAVVTMLIGRTTARTTATDKAVRQEHLLERVKGLDDSAFGDMPALV